jgi:ribosomal protein S18 acetylase RimI-like enzyme
MTIAPEPPPHIRLTARRDLARLEWDGAFSAHRALIRAAYRRQCRGTVAMLIAEQGGDAVGQAWIDLVQRARAGAAVVWAVRAQPGRRGQGIGTALMDAAEAAAAALGFAAVEVGVEKSNERARRFYQRRGYEPAGELFAVTRFRAPDGAAHELLFDQWRLRKGIAPAGTAVAPPAITGRGSHIYVPSGKCAEHWARRAARIHRARRGPSGR